MHQLLTTLISSLFEKRIVIGEGGKADLVFNNEYIKNKPNIREERVNDEFRKERRTQIS